MMKNFEVIIGIENHIELKTNTKIFSSGIVNYGATPNTNANVNDLGYPGALPTVNREGVRLAILACNALNLKIESLLQFDRKNYFYPDLAKGFQITQQFHPIGSEGILPIVTTNGKTINVEIERLHIEEDTAKQIHKDELTYLDYNRSGIGLIEIVTKPVLRSADEACAYVEKLREIMLFLNVSDVKMNEGSLRTDVNISLRPIGATSFSNKVEIKNLNSILNIRKSIEFEIERQTNLLLQGEVISQETRRFDDSTNITVLMRSKSDALDYKYFREPNIAPIQLDLNWIKEVKVNSPELADQKRIRYVKDFKLNLYDVNIILASLEMTQFFEETLKHTNNAIRVMNFLISDVQSELNKDNKNITEIKLSPIHLADLVNLLDNNIISSKHAKTILPIILNSNDEAPSVIIEKLGLKLINDEKIINEMLDPIFEEYKELLGQYNDRPERVVKTIMGQLMKKSEGNVNPDIATNIIIKRIESN